MNPFFDFLQVSIGSRDALLRVPSSNEWEEFLTEAQRHAIVGVMFRGLERLPKEQRPPQNVLFRWIGMGQMIEASGRLHRERSKELYEMVSAIGFQGCVLKGVAIARYYPEPLRRQCGDIDFWIPSAKRKGVLTWLKSKYVIEHHVWHNIGVKIFEDVPVEIHLHPAWVYHPIHNYRLQQWFTKMADRRMMTENGYYVMPVEFDAVFSLVHTFRHLIIEGVGMRHIVDYYFVLKGLPKEKHKETMKTISMIGLGKFTAAMMFVLKEMCGMSEELLLCKPNEKEGLFFMKETMAAGNFGKARNEGQQRNKWQQYHLMIRHYPSEMLWMFPWKVWHRCWRAFL